MSCARCSLHVTGSLTTGTLVHCTQEEFIELCATVNNMNPTYPGNFRRAMEEFDK